MAGIPISEIPNAPRLGGPVLIERGGPRTTDIDATTRSLLTKPMSAAGAVAMGQAYQNLGEGVSELGEGLADLGETGVKVAAVLQDWSKAKAQATDYDSLNQGQQIIDTRYGQFQKNIAGQPESVVKAEMENFRKDTTEQTAKLPFTAEGRKQFTSYYDQRIRQASAYGLQAANARFGQQGHANALARHEKLIEARDYEGAAHLLERGVQAGYFRRDQVMPIQENALTRQERRDMDHYIADNPLGAREYLEEHQQTGANPYFPRLTKDELTNDTDRARTAVRDLQRQTGDAIDTAVLSGQARDEKSIRDLATRAQLPEDEIQSHLASLRDVPISSREDRARYLKSQSELSTVIENYDPQEDPSESYYLSLKRAARGHLPMSERAAALQQINERREKGMTPQDRARGSVYEQIDALSESGALGSYHAPSGEIQPERMMRTLTKTRALKEEFARFLKAAPDASAADQRKWLSDRVTGQVILRGARLLRSRQPNPAANTPGGR